MTKYPYLFSSQRTYKSVYVCNTNALFNHMFPGNMDRIDLFPSGLLQRTGKLRNVLCILGLISGILAHF